MRAFGAMLATSIKTYMRNKGSVFFGIAFPLILMGLIGVAFGGGDDIQFTVSFVDEGNAQVAAPLLAGLRQVAVFRIIEEPRATALGQLKEYVCLSRITFRRGLVRLGVRSAGSIGER